ncbi:MAG: ParB/RepB/Spo0J family partition protein [Planctomycetales bacterium]|nr:ParB/RepB/Spo0J family partition protein [Planctomycetales bacterium]
MTRERRLGRGLEALLSQPVDADSNAEPFREQHAAAGPVDPHGTVWINVYEIDRNPFQPRHVFRDEEIHSLADSVRQHGMLQPVIVRRIGDRYQLISGERRWRAATVASWEKVPCLVREADDRQMAELAIVENVQRKDLGPLEKASSFERYLEQYGCTQEELATRINLDRSTIANLIRLLELPEAVRTALAEERITQGHARALLPLGEEREQIQVCQQIQDEQLSVRATEQLVSSLIREADGRQPLGVAPGTTPSAPRSRSEQISSLEQELRAALGTKVDIREGAKGKGRIVIHFKSHDEFNRLRSDLAGGSHGEQSRAG